jgi:predicted RNA-binding protein with PUA-like domain
MATWLFKSEPEAYSWQRLRKDGRTDWSGVRNYQANNNMKAMKIGDRGFFYHSVTEKRIVGIVEVIGAWRPDPSDKSGRFGMVSVKPVADFHNPVTLDAIKNEPALKDLPLLRQARLSVTPIPGPAWKRICALGGVKA